MWDCLEGVYMAADGGENCDAYVVPIRYFNKNSDGSLGEKVYEGYECPLNIPNDLYNSKYI